MLTLGDSSEALQVLKRDYAQLLGDLTKCIEAVHVNVKLVGYALAPAPAHRDCHQGLRV